MDAITVSILSAAISLTALGWSILSWRATARQTRLASNLSLLAGLKAKLHEMPSALRFHGISEGAIADCGLSVQEFGYLLTNFVAGQVYYEIDSRNRDKPFPAGDYRHTMCMSPDVRRAWPLIRTMLDNTTYRNRLELTVRTIEAERMSQPLSP